MKETLTPQAKAILRRVFAAVGAELRRDGDGVARVAILPPVLSLPRGEGGEEFSPGPSRKMKTVTVVGLESPQVRDPRAAMKSSGPGDIVSRCAWCATGEARERIPAVRVSHGICPACAAKYFQISGTNGGKSRENMAAMLETNPLTSRPKVVGTGETAVCGCGASPSSSRFFPREQSAANERTPLAVSFVGEPAGFACPVGLGVTRAGSFNHDVAEVMS